MTIDECLAELDPEHRAAVQEVIDAAGTSDADWNVLCEAGRLIVEARKETQVLRGVAAVKSSLIRSLREKGA